MPSGFSPANAIADEAWRSFTLTPAEVSALLQEAPPAWLTTMLGTAAPRATQSISFEFSSAAIVRPWFEPAVFKSRFWRFAQQERLLSDGKSPPTGECPAYVAAVVFARKVSVTGADPHVAPQLAMPFEGFSMLQTAQIARANVIKRQLAPMTTLEAASFIAQPATPTLVRRRHFAVATAAIAAPAVATRSAAGLRAFTLFDKFKVDRAADRPEFVGHLFTPVVVAPLPTPVPTPAPTQAPAIVPDANTVYVLAFICKSLPQCPNPDPGLQW
jgi:hypothetical protein